MKWLDLNWEQKETVIRLVAGKPLSMAALAIRIGEECNERFNKKISSRAP